MKRKFSIFDVNENGDLVEYEGDPRNDFESALFDAIQTIKDKYNIREIEK